jgi:glycosyltransferase involved in cell wall biosynthesis
VVSQPNLGRFEARRAGLEAATGDWVLLLDSRVTLHADGLAFVAERLDAGEHVWNGHVHVETDGNPYGAFWNVLVELVWREYFDDPRTTSFDAESFDRYPKGTGCFLVRREPALAGLEAYRTAYSDSRHANDDTPFIRWIAARQRIHLSPSFACDYTARASLRSFVRHSVHRGTVFLDGHGSPESRFYPLVVAFYPVSVGFAVMSLRHPKLIPALGAATATASGAVAAHARRSPFETVSFAALAPVFAVAHGIGMWRGLGMLVRQKLMGSPRS